MKVGALVVVNMTIGGITALANGAAAAVMIGQQPSWDGRQVGEAVLLAAVGLALLAPGILALAGKISGERVLQWQSLVLGVLVAALGVWGVLLLVNPVEMGGRTTWMIGILSGLAIYVFFLVRRSVDGQRFRIVQPAMLSFCALAVGVDVAVFARVGWF